MDSRDDPRVGIDLTQTANELGLFDPLEVDYVGRRHGTLQIGRMVQMPCELARRARRAIPEATEASADPGPGLGRVREDPVIHCGSLRSGALDSWPIRHHHGRFEIRRKRTQNISDVPRAGVVRFRHRQCRGEHQQ